MFPFIPKQDKTKPHQGEQLHRAPCEYLTGSEIIGCGQ